VVSSIEVNRERPEVATAQRRVRWRAPAALAAAVALATVALWSMGVFAWERVGTRPAERRELTLSDGSVVQLAPDSSLRVRLEPHSRRVVLIRGEAFFRVAHDSQRPFIVEAEYASVQATGTAFAVDRGANTVVVTVAEGSVAVRRTRPPLNPFAEAVPVDTRAVAVAAGEQVAVPRAGGSTATHPVDTTRELAWTVGHLIFDHDRVLDAANRFNRYNRTQIRIADEVIANKRISGVFDSSDPQSFVSFIASIFAVRVERTADEQIVIGAAEH
jgi:transmembrane sensor